MSCQDTFLTFCRFGDKDNTGHMDNVKFFKLCKEAHIVGGKVARPDVDLAFTKSLNHGERKLNYDQFLHALGILAEKKHPEMSKDQAHQKMQERVADAHPESKSTKVADDAILHKMTDTSQYTGAHKERFDKDGHGRGGAGRDMGANNKGDLSSFLDRDPNVDNRGVKR